MWKESDEIIGKLLAARDTGMKRVILLVYVRVSPGEYVRVMNPDDFRRPFRRYVRLGRETISPEAFSAHTLDDGEDTYQHVMRTIAYLDRIYHASYITMSPVRVARAPPRDFIGRIAYAMTRTEERIVYEYQLVADLALTDQRRDAARRRDAMPRVFSRQATTSTASTTSTQPTPSSVQLGSRSIDGTSSKSTASLTRLVPTYKISTRSHGSETTEVRRELRTRHSHDTLRIATASGTRRAASEKLIRITPHARTGSLQAPPPPLTWNRERQHASVVSTPPSTLLGSASSSSSLSSLSSIASGSDSDSND